MKFIKDPCKVLFFCSESQLHTYRINKNNNKGTKKSPFFNSIIIVCQDCSNPYSSPLRFGAITISIFLAEEAGDQEV